MKKLVAKPNSKTDKVLEKILREIQVIREDTKYFKDMLSYIELQTIANNRKIDSLILRIEHLEAR